ncbi:DinB family protein [Fulvivirgaceae bacterium BMA12]|uniref:DinB family protein n=1 Tax=Agaribacillus aureus TaxID=3051825 RepID=A0ABT8L708_9BACT|nr:DinB family protein [Fulvivirgaceae bacterium BMA12]
MDKAIQSDVLELLKFNSQLFDERIASLTREQSLFRTAEKTNAILWIAGHLTNSRIHLLELLGEKREYAWSAAFKEAYNPDNQYPDLMTLSKVWQEVSTRIFDQLTLQDRASLEAEIGYELPHGINTIRGAFVFWLYHEAWHLGQIAILRKAQGMEGLVPY